MGISPESPTSFHQLDKKFRYLISNSMLADMNVY